MSQEQNEIELNSSEVNDAIQAAQAIVQDLLENYITNKNPKLTTTDFLDCLAILGYNIVSINHPAFNKNYSSLAYIKAISA